MRKFFDRRSNQLFVVFVFIVFAGAGFQNCTRVKAGELEGKKQTQPMLRGHLE